MRNIYKVAASMLCAGVLLGGLGTGLAIAEYTSLEYTGMHLIGEEMMQTENFDVEVELQGEKKIIVRDEYDVMDIKYAESVPEFTVRYVVTYNPELVNIRGRYEAFEPDHDYQGQIWMSRRYMGDGFGLFMKNKDQILADLKQGKIGSYQTEDIRSVEIWMNPQMKEFTNIEF